MALREFRDLILNNKLVTFLSVALFAFIISTMALASSNLNKKRAIQQCEANIWDLTMTPRCSVNILSDIPDNDPVYLKVETTTLKLWAPYGSDLTWNKTSERTALLCPGSGNELEQSKKVLSYSTCVRGTYFSVEGTQEQLAKDLKCKTNVSADIYDTKYICARSGSTLFKIGFKVDDTTFITYVESCFDTLHSFLYYTQHVLPGAAIANAVPLLESVDWRKDGIADAVNPENSFKQEAQLERFKALLKSQELAEKYLGKGEKYLTRGHMTPKGDGIFRSWKRSTFFYTNAVPQWNDINGGNWKHIEEVTRYIASSLKEDVLVIQGTMGELQLPDVNGSEVTISLEENAFVVPLWTWKIVKSPSMNAGIAFATLNNPYQTKVEDSMLLCENICDRSGWSTIEFTDFKKGYTICCDPNVLIHNVPHATYDGLVQKVLFHNMLPSSAASMTGCLQIVLLVIVVQLIRIKLN